VPFRFESEAFLGHFCLPTSEYTDVDNMVEVFKDAFYENVMGNGGAEIFYDIQTCWAVILVASICTFILAYIYLFLIKLLGGIIIWVSLACSLLLFIGAGFYSYFPARNQYDPADPTYDYLAYAAYVSWALAGILLITILFCFNAIQLGVAVFKTTSDYVKANMIITALPSISTVVSAIWFVVWLSSAVYIFSVGTPEARENYPYITEIKWSK
jgi:hypothetical protein